MPRIDLRVPMLEKDVTRRLWCRLGFTEPDVVCARRRGREAIGLMDSRSTAAKRPCGIFVPSEDCPPMLALPRLVD
jgi:hypothetical protein